MYPAVNRNFRASFDKQIIAHVHFVHSHFFNIRHLPFALKRFPVPFLSVPFMASAFCSMSSALKMRQTETGMSQCRFLKVFDKDAPTTAMVIQDINADNLDF
jgi:hypothetical protein